MEEAIAAVVPIATAADVAAWMRAIAQDFLHEREQLIAEEEASWRRNSAGMLTTYTPRPRRIQTMPSALLRTEPSSTPLAKAWRRAPTAFIAALVVVFVGLVTFLVRDLDGSGVTPAPAATPPPTAEARIPRAIGVRSDPAVSIEHSPMALDTAGVATSAADESLESESPPESVASEPIEPVAAETRPAPAAVKQPLRAKPVPVRVVRAAPTRPAARPEPAPAAAPPPTAKPAPAALDCTTPFYFEGKKKIFKPGCL